MLVLIAGLAVFFAAHAARIGGYRSTLAARFGERNYRIGYIVVSIIGLILIMHGYGVARSEGPALLYQPPVWMSHVTALLMVPVFILFAASYLPGKIKRAAKHPQFLAVKIWTVAHLLSNGDLASIVLFGSFLVWAVLGRIAAKRRLGETIADAMPQFGGNRNDLLAIGIGLVAYVVFALWVHEAWIGVPVFV